MPDSERSEQNEPHAVRDTPLPDVSETGIAGLGQLGEYRLLQKLGEGGMGVVYRALHVELERVVALKVVRSDRVGDTQAVERFRREIKAAGKLEHPNIVLAHDARQIDGTQLLVMEFIEGLDLAQLLDRTGPLPIADACEAIRQAALGLEHAHEHQLIHRDVKPSNLMLARNGAVKILDLGLARLHSAEKGADGTTGEGFVIGTPDYMAPEQASDCREVDARSDVYGLGCTLYALLTGDPPFAGPMHQQAYEKMMAHVHEPPVPVREHRPDVPESLNRIVERMLAKEPDDRVETAAEVAEALADFVTGSDLAGLLGSAIGRPATKRISAIETPRTSQLPKSRPIWLLGTACVVALVGALFWLTRGPTDRTDVPSPAGTPAPPAVGQETQELPGWIVLSWTLRGIGKPDLWLFHPDGGQRVQITNSPRHFDIHPCFSPDGRQVAFIRGRELDESTSLWVCQSDGSNSRELVVPEADGERVVSPVWRSDTELLYVRDPRLDRMPDMELWQVDIENGESRLLFPLPQAGMVTDISPAGDRLAIVLQRRGLWPMANIYVGDLSSRTVELVYQDMPDECKDARPMWSPDGEQLAWHHNFTRGAFTEHFYYGIGFARQSPDGKWTPRLQPEPDGQMTPLAWAPNGSGLLCARMSEEDTHAILVLIDDEFREKVTLFELDVHSWQPGKQDLGRLGDWAIVPPDVPIRSQ
jgi:serine/threonine protein kinase